MLLYLHLRTDGGILLSTLLYFTAYISRPAARLCKDWAGGAAWRT